MLIIFYSSLLSYMLFFSLCIAPSVNTILDRENSSRLLRNIFPKNFWYGTALSILTTILSFLEDNSLSLIISLIILLFFIINLYLIMPAINKQADIGRESKEYTNKFKKLHFLSVLIYLVNMILAIVALIILF